MCISTDAALRIYLAFVYLGNSLIYRIKSTIPINIFLGLLSILYSIHFVATFTNPPKCLLIQADSLDSVGAFTSLHTSKPPHTTSLLVAAAIILETGIDIRVIHVDGKKNVCADMLSQGLIHEY